MNPEAPRRVTIRDVAKLAEVSVATVSNVLTGQGRVKPETRARVEEAIRALDFTPDPAARSLIARKQRAPEAETSDRPAPELTVVGYVSADYTARLDVLPHRDDRITARSIEKTLGGPAANVAVMAAGLGEPWPVRTRLVTILGEDADSAWAVELLAERGVEAVCTAPGQRLSRCIVMVEPDGHRTIVNEPMAIPEAELLARLTAQPASPGRRALHLEGYQVAALAGAVAQARCHGMQTSVHTTGLDPAWRTLSGFTRLRELFDVVFLNREAARDVTGFRGALPELTRRVERLVQATRPSPPLAGLVLLTLGENGALLFDEAGQASAPAPVVDCVDATGAGDCFAGVFVAAWLNGTPPRTALPLAVAAASRSVTVMGAQELRPTGRELEALLAAAA
jgi:ribokinase